MVIALIRSSPLSLLCACIVVSSYIIVKIYSTMYNYYLVPITIATEIATHIIEGTGGDKARGHWHVNGSTIRGTKIVH